MCGRLCPEMVQNVVRVPLISLLEVSSLVQQFLEVGERYFV